MEGLIVTKQGHAILVDPEDVEMLSNYEWSASKQGRKVYAFCRVGDKIVYMHRMLLGLDIGNELMVDHINGCTLDNRRSNLRAVTSLENSWHVVNAKANKYGFKGVTYNRVSGRYQARIRVGDRRVSLGYFDTAEDASEAYSRAYAERNKNIGEFK